MGKFHLFLVKNTNSFRKLNRIYNIVSKTLTKKTEIMNKMNASVINPMAI